MERPCCDEPPWWERLEVMVADEPMVSVRRVGGLRRVDVPDGPRGVEVGDVIELPAARAANFAASGEWELMGTPVLPVDEEDG